MTMNAEKIKTGLLQGPRTRPVWREEKSHGWDVEEDEEGHAYDEEDKQGDDAIQEAKGRGCDGPRDAPRGVRSMADPHA